MAKRMVVVLMVAVAFLGAIYGVLSVLKKNEAILYKTGYTWHAETDSSGAGVLVRGRMIGALKNDIKKLIAALNKVVDTDEAERHRGDSTPLEFPKIVLQKIEGQTVNIEITNDQYLTGKMGSSGAQDFLAEVTYTLTEDPAIKAVNFVFNGGDNAMPGIYSRESFTTYTISDEGR